MMVSVWLLMRDYQRLHLEGKKKNQKVSECNILKGIELVLWINY